MSTSDTTNPLPKVLRRSLRIRNRHTSCLQSLPSLPLGIIFKMLGHAELKALRLVNKFMKQCVEVFAKRAFKHWDLSSRQPTNATLKKFSAAVNTVQGLILVFSKKFNYSPDDVIEGIRYIVDNHPELNKLHLHFRDWRFEENCGIISEFKHIVTCLEICFCNSYGEYSDMEGTITDQLSKLEQLRINTIDCGEEWISENLQTCSTTLKRLFIKGYLRIEECFQGNYLPRLEELQLDGRGSLFSDYEGLSFITRSCGQNLRKLTLFNDDYRPSFLCFSKLNSTSMPMLEYLNVFGDTVFDDRELAAVVNNFGKTLKFLRVSSTEISGEELSKVSGKLCNIRELDLSYNKDLTLNGVVSILGLCGTGLKILRLDSFNMNRFDEATGIFCKSVSPCLEELDLSECVGIENNSKFAYLMSVLKDCLHELKVLRLKDTLIKGEEISEALCKLVTLEQLDLTDCINLTDSGLEAILEKCTATKLRLINLADTYVTESKFSKWKGISTRFYHDNTPYRGCYSL